MSIFFNNAGEFQWLSITAIGSLLGVLIATFFSVYSNRKTLYNQKIANQENLKMQKELNDKNIEANIISKARIEWIQSVRDDVSEYIAIIYNMHAYAYSLTEMMESIHDDKQYLKELKRQENKGFAPKVEYQVFIEERGDLYKKSLNKIARTHEDINFNNFKLLELSNKIILKFSDNEEHKKIEETVIWFPLRTRDFKEEIKKENYKEAEKILSEFNSHVLSMRNLFREYFKQEWEVAKGEKLT